MKQQPSVDPQIQQWLDKLDNPATTHQSRAAVGDQLAQAGDPRAGVGVRSDGTPDFVWCDVPGGKLALAGKTGTFRVDPFQIAKYPVTWSQFRHFLDAGDGFADPRWWDDLIQGEGDEKRLRTRNTNANYPVVGVTWFEAVAFCRWSGTRHGFTVRLPTEWEWQQAATGGDRKNEFPWGENWNPCYTNTLESGLNRAIAVGLYPQGTAPTGAVDMSGNIWEWCLNTFKNPEDTVVAAVIDHRAVRGGSWFGKQRLAHTTARGDDHPLVRYGLLGLRVMRPVHS